MIRRIRDLLYDQGFTISGARNKMLEIIQIERDKKQNGEVLLDGLEVQEVSESGFHEFDAFQVDGGDCVATSANEMVSLKRELREIRELLSVQF